MARQRAGMLRWGWRLLVLALLSAGWALAAGALHVVVVPGDSGSAQEGDWRVLVLPKDRLGLRDTWADTRDWTLSDAQQHEALVRRLVEAGHAQHLEHVFAPEQLRRLDQMLEARRSVMSEED